MAIATTLVAHLRTCRVGSMENGPSNSLEKKKGILEKKIILSERTIMWKIGWP